jgi:hypothetical protein
MTSDFDYKKYSLEKLETWVEDAVSGDASPQEIYDVIKDVVEEQYYYHKDRTSRAYKLLALLNGNGHIQEHKKDKVKKWVLPVEECKDADTDETEYFISFPDDLLEAANLKEGDQVEWVDNGDDSYLLKKVEKHMTYQEMLDAGYWMTDDGFWMPGVERFRF